MKNIESLVQQFADQITAQVRQAVLADLRHMSLDQLFAAAKGGAAGTVAKAVAAPVVPAAAPAKRGPGRPRKNAAVAAPAAKAVKAARKTASGRLGRRSASDIQGTLDLIVTYLQQNPGSRSEHIVAGLGLDKKELPRPIMEGLASGVLSKEGQKRATQYYVAGGKRGRK